MKNEIKLENYYLPEQLENAIARFVEYYNYQRYHESLKNLTPDDVYHGKSEKILNERTRIKRETLKSRKKNYYLKKIMGKILTY